jgi:hypothetical protein
VESLFTTYYEKASMIDITLAVFIQCLQGLDASKLPLSFVVPVWVRSLQIIETLLLSYMHLEQYQC